MKTKNKRNYLKQNGITLIALVVTIVVLLILAGVSINAVFGQDGIIQKAKDAQNRMDEAQNSDWTSINDLNDWIMNQTGGNTGDVPEILEKYILGEDKSGRNSNEIYDSNTGKFINDDIMHDAETSIEFENVTMGAIDGTEIIKIEIKYDDNYYIVIADIETEKTEAIYKDNRILVTVKYLDINNNQVKDSVKSKINKNETIQINIPNVEGYKSKTVKLISSNGEKTYQTEGTLKKLSVTIVKELELNIIYETGETNTNTSIDFPTVILGNTSNNTTPIGLKPANVAPPTYDKQPDGEYMGDLEPLKEISGNVTITFDMTGKANVGDTVKVFHYDSNTNSWSTIATKIVPESLLIEVEVTSFSPFLCVVYHNNKEEITDKISDLAGTKWQMNEVLTDYSWLDYFDYKKQTGWEEMSDGTTLIFENEAGYIWGITKNATEYGDFFSAVKSSFGNQNIWIPKNQAGISSGWYITTPEYALDFLNGTVNINDVIQQFDFDRQKAPILKFGEATCDMFKNTTFIDWMYKNAKKIQ